MFKGLDPETYIEQSVCDRIFSATCIDPGGSPGSRNLSCLLLINRQCAHQGADLKWEAGFPKGNTDALAWLRADDRLTGNYYLG